MNLKTVTFISKSDLLAGCPSLQEAFDNADIQSFSWGGCDHSLVSLTKFTDALGGLDSEGEMGSEWDTILVPRVDALLAAGGSIFVDLEH